MPKSPDEERAYKAEKQRGYRKRDHDAAKGVEATLTKALTACTSLPKSPRRKKLHLAILKALEACAEI